MYLIIKILLLLSIIFKSIISSFQYDFGECGDVGYKAKSFESCKGKKTYDESKYCCFLKSGKIQECVEVLKEDIDDGEVKTTIKEIEKGIYEPWDYGNGHDLNKIYDKLNDFICDKSNFFYSNTINIILSIFLLIF